MTRATPGALCWSGGALPRGAIAAQPRQHQRCEKGTTRIAPPQPPCALQVTAPCSKTDHTEQGPRTAPGSPSPRPTRGFNAVLLCRAGLRGKQREEPGSGAPNTSRDFGAVTYRQAPGCCWKASKGPLRARKGDVQGGERAGKERSSPSFSPSADEPAVRQGQRGPGFAEHKGSSWGRPRLSWGISVTLGTL